MGAMMGDLTLFQLSEEHHALAERLTDMGLDEQTIADTLEAESMALETKATNVAMVVRNIDALAGSIREAEKQLAERRRTYERRAEWLRTYIQQCMTRAGIRKIEGPMLALTIKKNPAAVVLDLPGSVPAEFMRVPPPPPAEPDKAAIKEALKAGMRCEWAHLEQGERLEIK